MLFHEANSHREGSALNRVKFLKALSNKSFQNFLKGGSAMWKSPIHAGVHEDLGSTKESPCQPYSTYTPLHHSTTTLGVRLYHKLLLLEPRTLSKRRQISPLKCLFPQCALVGLQIPCPLTDALLLRASNALPRCIAHCTVGLVPQKPISGPPLLCLRIVLFENHSFAERDCSLYYSCKGHSQSGCPICPSSLVLPGNQTQIKRLGWHRCLAHFAPSGGRNVCGLLLRIWWWSSRPRSATHNRPSCSSQQDLGLEQPGRTIHRQVPLAGFRGAGEHYPGPLVP